MSEWVSECLCGCGYRGGGGVGGGDDNLNQTFKGGVLPLPSNHL